MCVIPTTTEHATQTGLFGVNLSRLDGHRSDNGCRFDVFGLTTRELPYAKWKIISHRSVFTCDGIGPDASETWIRKRFDAICPTGKTYFENPRIRNGSSWENEIDGRRLSNGVERARRLIAMRAVTSLEIEKEEQTPRFRFSLFGPPKRSSTGSTRLRTPNVLGTMAAAMAPTKVAVLIDNFKLS